jgi:putative ABC transport system permease protein
VSFFDSLRYRLRVFSRPRAHERELEEEMDFHLGLDTINREHAAHGSLTPNDARAAARRRFGNRTSHREEARRVAGLGFLDILHQDVRFALRSFRRAPTFTVVAILTLAIGIGANTAIFSAVDALLLRALPFREPDRLMTLGLSVPQRGTNPPRDDLTWSYPKFVAFRQAQTVFSDLTVWFEMDFTIRLGDEALRSRGEAVDDRYLPLLGVQPALGRSFLPEECTPGGPPAAILGHGVWTNVYGADPSVVGRMLDVEGTQYTIVGVAPPGFGGLSGGATFWIPLVTLPATWPSTYHLDPYNHYVRAIGRLAPGIDAASAKSVVAQVGARVDALYPDRVDRSVRWGAAAHELDAMRVDARIRRTLLILLGAVGLVLLIACANVANLFLVRASARHREIAVRLAVGSGRARIVRQLLVESLLLSVAGGLAGLAVAWTGVKFLSSLQPAQALRFRNLGGFGAVNFSTISLDLTTLGFAALLALATGLLFGLVPALQATRPSLTDALKDGAGLRSSGTRRLSSRNALVIAEIALAVVLLAGSGLMLRSLDRLLRVNPGFVADSILTLRVNRAANWSRDSIMVFYHRALTRLGALPGVTEVAMGDCPPVTAGCGAGVTIALHDRPRAPHGSEPRAAVHWITPNWTTVLRVPLLRGRLLSTADRFGTRAVVVSQTAAQRFWPGEDPVGRPMSVDVPGFGWDTAYVVGVVGDVRYATLDLPPDPDIYVSYYQSPISFRMMFFLRTRGDPQAIATAARVALREVAPGFPVYDVATLDSRASAAVAYARFSALLLALFAAMALGLATLGTYGVISFAAAQRTREIGVRVALGATRRDVVRLVVGQGVALAIAGSVFGLIAALAVTGVLRSLLYEIEPGDPATLVGIIGVLVIAVLVASWLPARRAAGVPPVQALRHN